MTTGWSKGRRPTQVVHGTSGLGEWLRGRQERRVTVLVDEGVADTAVTARIHEGIAWAGRHAESVVLAGSGDLDTITALAARLDGSDLVVAVGGGALLDQAKLAALLHADPAQRARFTVRDRSGLVLLPATVEPVLALVAVPTTVGTGSEVSSVACLASARGKRLVMGAGLQPDLAVLDPLATRTLPPELLAEGALEILFRVSGMYAGDHQDQPVEDALALALLAAVVRLGGELRDERAAGRAGGDGLRLELARLSGLSHTPWITLSRDPCACKGWYLANELSTALGLRKMTAAAALLPALWESILAPDARWGSARRLARLWETLRAAEPGLPDDPVAGIATLIDSWRVERRIAAQPDLIEATAAASVRAWGAGLPMLAGLSTADVQHVLTRSLCEPALAQR